MSVIAILVDQKAIKPFVLMKLHKTMGEPLSTLRGKIKNDQPIVEIELFSGDYKAHSALIRSIVSVLDEAQVGARFYEIPYGANYTNSVHMSIWEIDGVSVAAILKAADEEMNRQFDDWTSNPAAGS